MEKPSSSRVRICLDEILNTLISHEDFNKRFEFTAQIEPSQTVVDEVCLQFVRVTTKDKKFHFRGSDIKFIAKMLEEYEEDGIEYCIRNDALVIYSLAHID